jgi:hypothetical protein
VIVWFSPAVASFAISCPNSLMVEIGFRPIGGIMTGRALSTVMIGGFSSTVAGFAIGRANGLVVEVSF